MGVDLARHWRLNEQRYKMTGDVCKDCNYRMFPPREVCPKCAESSPMMPFPIETSPEMTKKEILSEPTEVFMTG